MNPWIAKNKNKIPPMADVVRGGGDDDHDDNDGDGDGCEICESIKYFISAHESQQPSIQPTSINTQLEMVFSEIFVAKNLPPSTANPVHMACPNRPPNVTPRGSCAAANAMVVICDRSPHSARKVMVNVCSIIELRSWRFLGLYVFVEVSMSFKSSANIIH